VFATARVRVRGPSAIVVTPTDTSIAQGDSAQFRAKVLDQAGDSISGLTLTWQSSNTTVATVTQSGLAKSVGTHSGVAQIQARYGTLVGQANLTVRDTTILANRVPLTSQPFGAAVFDEVAYVTLAMSSKLARTDLPSQTFPVTVTVGSTPTNVVFNSTGARAYVTNQASQSVGVVDVATNTQIDLIAVHGDPFVPIVQPGDSILYVSTNTGYVYGIRLATKELVDSIPTGAIGSAMLIRDSLLYISTWTNGRVLEFNLRTRTLARTFAVGGTPQRMAISPDGNTLYIANEADRVNGYVQFWDRVNNSQIGANIPLPGAFGYDIARRPTNGLLYVSTAYAGWIFVVDPATRTVIRAVQAGGSPRTFIFDANGVGFVTNEAGWVDFIK
jgi:YVTN family beta-propeller protein